MASKGGAGPGLVERSSALNKVECNKSPNGSVSISVNGWYRWAAETWL